MVMVQHQQQAVTEEDLLPYCLTMVKVMTGLSFSILRPTIPHFHQQ
jgi:hypothetical protein